MKKLIIILFAFGLLAGCRTQKLITSDVSDVTIDIQKVRPDTITTPADSTLLKAYFRCDSLGNVYIAQIIDLSSKGVNTAVNFDNGMLSYNTNRPETKTITFSIDHYFSRTFKKTITNTITIIKMSLFQKIFFWIGILLTAVAGGVILAKLKGWL